MFRLFVLCAAFPTQLILVDYLFVKITVVPKGFTLIRLPVTDNKYKTTSIAENEYSGFPYFSRSPIIPRTSKRVKMQANKQQQGRIQQTGNEEAILMKNVNMRDTF